MPARSVATATIETPALGSIPVKLFTTIAPGSKPTKLVSLHEGCGGRLQQRMKCTKCDAIVDQEKVARAVEGAEGEYHELSADELAQLDSFTTQTIRICEYLPLDAIDPIYVDKSFYLAPDKGGEEAFGPFLQAIQSSRVCAVGTYSAHRRSVIVNIREHRGGVLMQTLRHHSEVIPIGEVGPLPLSGGSMKLIDQAEKEIEAYTHATFQPTMYEDEVQAKITELLELVAAKASTPATSTAKGPTNVVEMVDALKGVMKRKKS